MAAAARAAAATGVDIVKLGFFPGANHRALAESLAPLGEAGIRLVAVLMADRQPDLGLAANLAVAGFLGVMLDTADKQSGSSWGTWKSRCSATLWPPHTTMDCS